MGGKRRKGQRLENEREGREKTEGKKDEKEEKIRHCKGNYKVNNRICHFETGIT